MEATTTIEVTTTNSIDLINLELQINFLLATLKCPDVCWTVDKLTEIFEETKNSILESGSMEQLANFMKEIKDDKDILKTLTKCGKQMFDIIKSMSKKYKAKGIKIIKGSVCLTFCFATNNDLENYIDKLREKECGLIGDISKVILSKPLLDVFHVDSKYVSWTISKVTVNKGLYIGFFFHVNNKSN